MRSRIPNLWNYGSAPKGDVLFQNELLQDLVYTMAIGGIDYYEI